MTLRTRIITGFAVVMVMVIGLGVAVVLAQRSQLIEQLDRQLEAIAPLDRPAPPDDRRQIPPRDDARAPEQPISDVYIAAVFGDGTVDVLVEGQLLDATPDLDALDLSTSDDRRFDTIRSSDGSTRFRTLTDVSADGAFVTVIAVPTTDVDATVRNLGVTFAAVAIAIAAILGLVAIWVVRLGLRPISTMTDTARAIASGDRDERAPEIDQRTEAGQLAAAFNVMLDQRDEADDTLRRFASDASHELRTPLTSIRGYLDLYAAGGFREPGQLDDVVRRMRDEAARMGDLVEQLLQLARLDEAQGLAVETVDLEPIVADVVANARAAHPDRTIVLHSPPADPSPVEVDPSRVKQLTTVLVDNALTHAPEATIEVTVRSSPSLATIEVADDGPGLDPADAERVFTRFYRSASSRTRATGGSGLGLGIAQSIAEAHGGSITLRTALGEGCVFTVDLPADATSRPNGDRPTA